jgi:hypothetical protein
MAGGAMGKDGLGEYVAHGYLVSAILSITISCRF